MNQNEIENIIRRFLDNIPLQAEDICFSLDDNGQALWCQIKSKDYNSFIGRDGEVLSALNHILRKVVERYFFEKNKMTDAQGTQHLGQKIIIDINNFQRNKIENLKTTAHMLSERARFFKSNIETDPLSAFDRKTIHEFLSEKPNITTESVGSEPHRRVLIKYTEN
jgi:spoIIIJ-associated protein